MQLEEYVLWRLRDVPGQRTLSAFRQQPGTNTQTAERPMHISAALPPSPYGKFPSSATLPSPTHTEHPDPEQTALLSHRRATAAVQASDAHTDMGQQPEAFQRGRLDFGDADTASARAALMPEAELDPLSHSHDMAVLPYAADMGHVNDDKLVCSHYIHASAAANGGGMVNDTHQKHMPNEQHAQQAQQAQQSQWAQQPQQAQLSAALHAQTVTFSSATAAAAPAADDYRVAHERAAAARAACDMLRGPPKSSRDDPHFMDSYYKSSRLSFIGRWKARIEALTASMAADAPLPKTVQQPSALLNAFKADKGVRSCLCVQGIYALVFCFTSTSTRCQTSRTPHLLFWRTS